MKRIINWVLFASLFLGLTMQTSCSSDDDGDSINGEVRKERDQLLTHIEDDVQSMDETLDFELFDMITQVQTQLLTYMGKDPRFSNNLKKVVSLMAVRNAFQNIHQVENGSELAAMGYQAYIPVDIMAFGVRVIFDENGNYTMKPAEGLEFVFPATVEGYGQTLYKIALRNEGEWYESVTPAQLNGVRGLACVNRYPKQLNLRMTGLFNDEEVTLCTGVLATMLEKTPDSQYVSFQTNEFQMGVDIRSALKGNTYGLPDDDSAIAFSWGTIESSAGTLMNILSSFTQKGKEMLNGVAVVTLPEQKVFIDNIIDNINTSSSDWQAADAYAHFATIFKDCRADVVLTFLDDLTLSGSIEDSEQFFNALSDIAQNREVGKVSADEYGNFVQALNNSCHFSLACPTTTKPVSQQLQAQQEDARYILMPALQFADKPGYVPLNTLVTEDTNERFQKMYEKSTSFVTRTLDVDMQLIYRMIRLMPMNSEEWGLLLSSEQ